MATTPRTARWWMTRTEPIPMTDDDEDRIIETWKRERVKQLKERERKQMRWARLHPVERGLAYFILFIAPVLIFLTIFIPAMQTAGEAMFWTWLALYFPVAAWLRWRGREVDASQGDLGIATPSTTQRRSLWPFWSLLPFGLGTWGVAYAGVRARCTGWIALGGLWSATALAGWILAFSYPAPRWENTLAVWLILAAWAGAVVTSFVIRREYDRRMGIRPYCDRCGRYRESKRCPCERRALSSARQERVKQLTERERAQMRWARMHPVERVLVIFLVYPVWLIPVIFIPASNSAGVAMFLTWLVLLVAMPFWFRWRLGSWR